MPIVDGFGLVATVGVTVTTAALDFDASAVAVAMIVTVPPDTPVTLPVASTVATAALLDVHETVFAVVPSAETDAASVIDVPCGMVADCGETVTLMTPSSAVVVPVTPVTIVSPPQAAISVPNAITPASSKERETLCILPPKEWCVK